MSWLVGLGDWWWMMMEEEGRYREVREGEEVEEDAEITTEIMKNPPKVEEEKRCILFH